MLMGYKDNLETKHFYSITCDGWNKKKDKSSVFLFLETIEKTLNDYPKNKDDVLEVIRQFLKSVYVLLWDSSKYESFLRAAVYVEGKAEELEKKYKLSEFVDFSEVENDEIKALNNLRINLRILESLFWESAEQLPDRGEYLVVPHFLNVASKYVFYYIIDNYDIQKFYRGSKLLIDFNKLNVDEDKFKKYCWIYQNKKLSDFL